MNACRAWVMWPASLVDHVRWDGNCACTLTNTGAGTTSLVSNWLPRVRYHNVVHGWIIHTSYIVSLGWKRSLVSGQFLLASNPTCRISCWLNHYLLFDATLTVYEQEHCELSLSWVHSIHIENVALIRHDSYWPVLDYSIPVQHSIAQQIRPQSSSSRWHRRTP